MAHQPPGPTCPHALPARSHGRWGAAAPPPTLAAAAAAAAPPPCLPRSSCSSRHQPQHAPASCQAQCWHWPLPGAGPAARTAWRRLPGGIPPQPLQQQQQEHSVHSSWPAGFSWQALTAPSSLPCLPESPTQVLTTRWARSMSGHVRLSGEGLAAGHGKKKTVPSGDHSRQSRAAHPRGQSRTPAAAATQAGRWRTAAPGLLAPGGGSSGRCGVAGGA